MPLESWVEKVDPKYAHPHFFHIIGDKLINPSPDRGWNRAPLEVRIPIN